MKSNLSLEHNAVPQGKLWIESLVAALFTPLHLDGNINLLRVAPLVERLLDQGVGAFYIFGDTGEGPHPEFFFLITESRSIYPARDMKRRQPQIPTIKNNKGNYELRNHFVD